MNAPPSPGDLVLRVDASRARELTDRIKVAVDGTWLLIQEAYLSRAWASLGYTTWDDYCTREFGTSRLRLPREDRQEVVASMRESGMSVRAIASATGDPRETVRRDLAGDPNGSPGGAADQTGELLGVPADQIQRAAEIQRQSPGVADRVLRGEIDLDEAEQAIQSKPITGTDGKTYTPTQRPPSKPRTDVVTTVNRALLRAHEAARAADEITRQHLAGRTEEAATWSRSLSTSMQSLQRLLDQLTEAQQ